MIGFDIKAYCGRIGFTGKPAADLATLQAFHALQPDAIPFENLDPLMGREVRLDPASLQDKLVAGRRGGYCFELNGLLALALDHLGFKVTRLGARVRWMVPPEQPDGPRSHMLLRVDVGGAGWLVDVGFGAHLLAAPVRLERDVVQDTPASQVRLVGDDRLCTLQARLPGGWQDMYRFTPEPQLAADYMIANWFTSTHPLSRFTGNLVAERLTATARYNLFNTKLVRRGRDGGTEERVLASVGDLADALSLLGIVPPVDSASIWDRIPRE